MNTTQTERKHSLFFKGMHWLVAATIITSFLIIWSIDYMPFSPEKIKMINYHKWFGFTVLALFIPRLISALTGYAKLPVLNAQDKIAKAVHGMLYLTMFTTPLLGWVMSSAKGFTVVWFGLVTIPDLLSKDLPLGKILKEAHELSANILLACLAAHIGGAIIRQFLKKDPIITKMIS